ncbi:MAG: GxxExxY protein [Patescibacteria group bacterium]|mgnify:CR=1 FL=1
MGLLYEDQTKQIIGALYRVYNTLGFGYKEKEYQKAFAIELEKLGIRFKRELYSVLKYEDKVLTKFFVDFLVEDKIVVELKVATDFYLQHRQQVIQYLKNHNLKVGIIGVITPKKVLIKRVVN